MPAPNGNGGGNGNGDGNAPVVINIAIDNASIGDLVEGQQISLDASGTTVTGADSASYLWEIVVPQEGISGLSITSPNAAVTSVRLPYLARIGESINLQFRVTVRAGSETATRQTEVLNLTSMADSDSDGLIEIRDLSMLHNMRHNLNGTSYRTSATDSGVATGCPNAGCNGYELIRDLDFDADGDNTTYTSSTDQETMRTSYTLDSGDSREPYFVVAADGTGGWQPIGDLSTPLETDSTRFRAIFDGNGYSIHNLSVLRTVNYNALFGVTNAPGHIRNVHMVNALAVGGQFSAPIVGVALTPVVASSASGIVVTSSSTAGGLLAQITAQVTTNNFVTASYSTANVTHFSGSSGALLAIANESNLSAVYATGSLLSTSGGGTAIGSVIGDLTQSTLSAAYASGNVGQRVVNDRIGNLIGLITGNTTVNRSFGFGTPNNNRGTALPTVSDGNGGMRPIMLSELTLELANGGASAANVWNSATHNTLGAWDFENRAIGGGPSLRYADYDGPGTRFYCAGETVPTVGENDPLPIRIARCGEHLPHQFATQ